MFSLKVGKSVFTRYHTIKHYFTLNKIMHSSKYFDFSYYCDYFLNISEYFITVIGLESDTKVDTKLKMKNNMNIIIFIK